MSCVVIRVALLALVAVIGAGCAHERPPSSVSAGPSTEAPYILGSGDRLRITVFNQPTLSTTYSVDASGTITMPLLGPVEAAGRSPYELKKAIEARLAKDFLREPNVSVEVEGYRPFFIFGQVTTGGQYAYVAGMTVEQAVAIAGGYTPRAQRNIVQLARRDANGVTRVMVPLTTIIRPGDTIFVKERWF
jgi:polysaccharide export outer membrane protein